MTEFSKNGSSKVCRIQLSDGQGFNISRETADQINAELGTALEWIEFAVTENDAGVMTMKVAQHAIVSLQIWRSAEEYEFVEEDER